MNRPLSFMDNVFGKESARTLLSHVLPRLIADLQAGAESASASWDDVYGAALRAVVAALLSSNGRDGLSDALSPLSYAPSPSLDWICDNLGPLEPVEVGKLYEYARGFRLDAPGGKGQRIVPCATGKRNQGLFYTPGPIVRYIVSETLGSLELSRSEDLLDVRIMDPAVGTGLFLTEALEQLTLKTLEYAVSGDQAIVRRIGQLKKQASNLFRQSGIRIDPTDRVAVRVHLVTHCLHGVDLDPTAVAISRAALCAKAVEGMPLPRGIEPLIRVGNSLIGQKGCPYSNLPSKDELHARELGAPTRTETLWLSRQRSPQGRASAAGRQESLLSLREAERMDGAKLPLPLGEGKGEGSWQAISRSEATIVRDEDIKHAEAYFGTRSLDKETVAAWVIEKNALHWPHAYPEIFGRENGGFDAVVGNPPYEIVSVKESGIKDRTREQAYFRRTYRTCSGKINTYRLMLERALTLLRDGGALGFIVPATLLADSSAARLRRLILDESDVLQAVIVPEKARAFKGVTQACLIIVVRKGHRTRELRTRLWHGQGDISDAPGARISRQIIDRTDLRIPLLRSAEEKALLEALLGRPPLRGDDVTRPAGRVHQGEINMTVHRRFLSARRTSHPLARGEHVEPFRIAHPSSRSGRWDWMVEDFLEHTDTVRQRSTTSPRACVLRDSCRGEAPWNRKRIVLARVVNMGTKRRLKAALVQPGTFLGDMTNYITDMTTSVAYLLGLLNSRLLNWRIKLTSTNNYLSATEVEALPVPRMAEGTARMPGAAEIGEMLKILAADPESQSLEGAIRVLRAVQGRWEGCHHETLLMRLIELLSGCLTDRAPVDFGDRASALNVLDAIVVELFRVESLVGALREEM